ncbi:MAG: hypothetical protein DME69_14830 [Verrucomicrobia bacterium]|nr:MAG: hypothetical protein DME69_14830 [Verrucomicrobiota bacterium]
MLPERAVGVNEEAAPRAARLTKCAAAPHDSTPSPGNAIGYAKLFRLARDAVIRVFDEAGNVIDTHERVGDFKRAGKGSCLPSRAKQEAAAPVKGSD